MAAKTDPINTSNPAGDSDPKQGDDYIRTLAKALIELLTVDHYVGVSNPWGSDASGDETGEHARVMFHEAISNPSVDAGKGVLFIKGTPPELYFRDEDDGDVIQLTNGGIVNLTSAALLGILAKNTYFTAVNNAEDGTVNLIKAGTNDLATLPDGAEMASDAAPGEAEGIANRKYVNDQDTAQFASGGSIEGIFGSWTAKDSGGSVNLVKDEVYKVGSDGFVVIYDTDSPSVITILTDGSNPPTTSRQSSGGIDNKPGSCNCPIKKNDYWKVTCAGVVGLIYWLPIGTGTCVKQ